MTRRSLSLALALVLVGAPRLAGADPEVRAEGATAPKSRPLVLLDRLDLSAAPAAVAEEGYLREVLAHEARRADWGALRGSRIEYRFRLDALDVTEKGGVLHVSCAATGWLPNGKHAKSHLAFGGAPADRKLLVHHVLEIVASGVVTRLAEMERRRRHAP